MEKINDDYFGFTEYQGASSWDVTPESQKGTPFNLFICNRCREFRFWARVHGEFPVVNLATGIDPYREANIIIDLHKKNFCYIKKERQ